MQEFLSQIQAPLLELLAMIVTYFIGLAALKLKEKYKIEIEDKYKRDLHDGIMSGIKAALVKLGSQAPTEQIVEDALVHAQKSNRDAFATLKPSEEVLGKIAASKVPAARAEAISNEAQINGKV